MKKDLFAYCIAVACLLSACGDDSSTSPSNNTGDSQVSSSSTASIPASSAKVGSDSKEVSSSSTVQSSSAVTSSSSKEIASSSAAAKGFPANYNQETGILTDERDGEVYKTAKIGDQIWMGQNLRYYTTVPAEGCEFTYNDETEDVPDYATYGRLYSWIGATRVPCDYISKKLTFGSDEFPTPHQGICPKGWHIPSLDEWKKMIEFTDSHLYKLLSKEWVRPGYAGTDEYGFNVLFPKGDNKHVEYIMLDNSGSKSQTMVFNDIGGSTLQMETILTVKSVNNINLRCLMD
ncbi:MAG: hypothetical protein IJ908_11050 [Fibrobacter sp.]|nr:hypothetical protein [Fibrobacter sp.]